MKITKNGIFKNKRLIKTKTEADFYKILHLPFIEPELRGNIAPTRIKKWPKLVTLADIRGDLHCHTPATDGRFSLEEMALAAKDHGYEYVAITDHS